MNQATCPMPLGTIEVPIVAIRRKQPQPEVLANTEAGNLVGVEACNCSAAQYTAIGTPRFPLR